jgi:hypothetical protein
MLQWISSLWVSVLFIPVLCILAHPPIHLLNHRCVAGGMGLACDYSVTPYKLVYFKNMECGATQHLPIAIAAFVLLIILMIYALFASLTFYEYDPTVPKTYLSLIFYLFQFSFHIS